LIEQYAIDPAAIYRNKDSINRFLTDFNAENGRVVAAIPRKWFEEHQLEIKKWFVSPMARKRALDKLMKIKNHSLITGYSTPQEIATWINKAIYLKESSPISAILSTRRCSDNEIYCYEDILEEAPINWEIGQTISVIRNAEVLTQTIRLSLELATTAYYIDPYFFPSDGRFVAPLLKFIEVLRTGKHATHSITIHTSMIKGSRSEFERGMQDFIAPELPNGFTVKLFFWQSQELHDRFILTKNVGYAFGHGLDEAAYESALKVNVNRLSENVRKIEFEKFSMKDDINDNPIIIHG
jgi:hypothetical protein